MWVKAKEDKLYQLSAKMVADKVSTETAFSLSNNPIKKYLTVMEGLSVIQKKGITMMLMNYTTIFFPATFWGRVLSREHISGEEEDGGEHPVPLTMYYTKGGDAGANL